MKLKFSFVYSLGVLTLASGITFAIQDPALDPTNGAGWATNAGDINNITAQNAASAPGNLSGTYYWFAATDSQSNLTYPIGGIVSSNNGHTVISNVAGISSGGGFSEQINGNTVSGVLASTNYSVYAQACPNLVSPNTGTCSNWVRLKTGTVTTRALPPAPFITPVRADVTINSIQVHANVPDPNNVQFWHVRMKDVDGGNTVQDLGNRSYSVSQTINYGPAGGYNVTLKPNNHYQYLGQVLYFWSQVTPAVATVGDFTTTPLDPGPISASWTHFTATFSFNSNNGGVDNPSGTKYQISVAGSGAVSPPPVTYTGTNPMTVKVTGLQAGQHYTACVQALNNDSNWNNSNSQCVPGGFDTLPINPTYLVTGVQTNQATFNVTLNPPTGITDYIVERCVGGVNGTCVQDVKTTWTGSSISDTMGSLTPNTAYQFYIRFFESADFSAFSPQPDQGQGVNQFTTTPTDPSGFVLTNAPPVAKTLHASWTVGPGNPSATANQIQYCTDSACSVGCNPVNVTNNGSLRDIPSLLEETAYSAHVRALTVGGGANSGYSNCATATTINEAPNVSAVTVVLHITSATLSATATDNDPAATLRFHWVVTASPGGSTFGFTVNDAAPNGSGLGTTQLTFNVPGTYSGTLVVTDKNGSGAASTPVPWSTSATLVPTTVKAITPNPGTVVVGAPAVSFSAEIDNQFGGPMTSGLTGVTWSLNNGAATNSPVSASTFTLVTGANSSINGGSATLTVRLANGASQSVPITVKPAGILFSGANNPSVTLIPNANGVTSASLHCAATDNNPNFGAVHYAWSLESGRSAVAAIPALGDTTVTFSAEGTYSFRCTVTDDLPKSVPGFAVTNSTTVVQVVNSILVCPLGQTTCDPTKPITVNALQTQKFSPNGIDQFGDPMTLNNVSWSVTGCPDCVSAAGDFRTSTIGQQFTLTATANGVPGSALVRVISFDVSGAYAYPVPYKASFGKPFIYFKNLGTQAKIRIYTASGRKVFDTEVVNCADQNDCFQWNVKNSSGENLASGVYFYVIESPEGKKDGKLIIIQ